MQIEYHNGTRLFCVIGDPIAHSLSPLLHNTMLQALGEKRSAFFLSIARQGLFYIPIIWILPSLLGKLGIFMAQPCADYLTILTVIFLCRHLFVDLMKG